MKIALDCNALIEISRPDDSLALFRLKYLVKDMDAVLVVPTPVIAEYLVKLEEEGGAWLLAQRKRKNFLIPPFDYRSAQECALLERQAAEAGMKFTTKTSSRQKIKVDRQILAVALVNQCSKILTADTDLAKLATWLNLNSLSVDDLPRPPEEEEDRQMSLDIPEDLDNADLAPPDQNAQLGTGAALPKPTNDGSPAPG